MKLSLESFEKAIQFVRAYGRPVDRASLACFLAEGEEQELIQALSEFQNEDGGFGHAIEADFRVPDSSVTATTVAFQTLIEHQIPSDVKIVQKGVEYLVASFDSKLNSWPPMCEKVTDYPRANWWEYYPPVPYKPNEPNWGNPNIEVIGILNRYADLVSPEWLESLNTTALEWVGANEKVEPHALMCAIRYGETLSGEKRRLAKEQLSKMALGAATTEEAKWSSYSPQPVWFVKSPGDILGDVFGEAIERNLDFIIQQQSADGSWQPSWEWGRFPEEWHQAKAEWAGVLTVQNLKMLKAFGRIALRKGD